MNRRRIFGYISTDIIVEKYLKEGLEKAGRGNEVLLYSQRQFDALIIARYQKGTLGDEIQGLILNKESDSQLWKAALRRRGVEKSEFHGKNNMKKDTISKMKDFNSTKEEQITLSKNYKIFEVFLEQIVSGEGMIGEKNTF